MFVISDTHFGHKNILKHEPEHRVFDSIESMNEEMVYRWNNVVRPCDKVIHLGDVLFGEHSFDILARLNGDKVLVMGNHDNYPTAKYLEHFKKIHGCLYYRGWIFTHIPVSEHSFDRYVGNVHGHLHSKVMSDPRYKNVSCEQSNLAPQLLDHVFKGE